MQLKMLPKYFQEVVDGNKRFEVREIRDRVFKVGQYIELVEEDGEPTGRTQVIKVTYILTYQYFPHGVKEGYCVLGLMPKTSKPLSISSPKTKTHYCRYCITPADRSDTVCRECNFRIDWGK